MMPWRRLSSPDEGTGKPIITRFDVIFLVPKKGLIQSNDLAVFDDDGAPGGHAAILFVIVTDDLERTLIGAFGSFVLDFLRLNVGAEVLLAVFEADDDVRRAF